VGEGIVRTPATAMSAHLRFRVSAFRGGPLRHADDLGAARIVESSSGSPSAMAPGSPVRRAARQRSGTASFTLVLTPVLVQDAPRRPAVAQRAIPGLPVHPRQRVSPPLRLAFRRGRNSGLGSRGVERLERRWLTASLDLLASRCTTPLRHRLLATPTSTRSTGSSGRADANVSVKLTQMGLDIAKRCASRTCAHHRPGEGPRLLRAASTWSSPTTPIAPAALQAHVLP